MLFVASNHQTYINLKSPKTILTYLSLSHFFQIITAAPASHPTNFQQFQALHGKPLRQASDSLDLSESGCSMAHSPSLPYLAPLASRALGAAPSAGVASGGAGAVEPLELWERGRRERPCFGPSKKSSSWQWQAKVGATNDGKHLKQQAISEPCVPIFEQVAGCRSYATGELSEVCRLIRVGIGRLSI